MTGVRRALAACTVALFLAGLISASAVSGGPKSARGPYGLVQAQGAPVLAEAGIPPPPGAPPDTTPAPAPEPLPEPVGPVSLPLSGCPPPPPPPGSGGSGGWRPSVLVPEDELAPAPEPTTLDADTSPLEGKGMWVWKYRETEGGDTDAIVTRALAAGLSQLWVRVGDSRDGFYGADVLARLVPAAHARGLAVIGWGFPYLWDPAADAAWTSDALAWRGPGGEALDGFSPDVEESTEGVQLTEARVRLYLGLVRAAAGDRLVVATVYRPTDAQWAFYPYAAMVPYVDAFAPMVYWGCTEPGEAATQALERLADLRPVHLIGQAYDMADDGGRLGPPGAEETERFLDVARRGGAVGASFWVWQEIGDDQWSAVADYPWSSPKPA